MSTFIEQVAGDLGFFRKAEGIYQKVVSAEQGVWVAAFDDGSRVTLSLGFIWYQVNVLAFKFLREAFKPHRPEFAPEVGPPLYLCNAIDLPKAVSDAREMTAALMAIQSDSYKRVRLSEAVSDAENVWPYQESHRTLLPAALSILGRQEQLQEYKALYLDAMIGSPLIAPYTRYYELLEESLSEA